ncbi:MAG: class II fructose-bisphosphatase [Alphaproteobacteria bacterium]|nr:class II fructose-bisphosphatase [Alphaproteobacteria bacterium]
MLKPSVLTSVLAYATVGATERAATAAARFVGSGDERAADEAAIAAMHSAVDAIGMAGRVVIGEGEMDDAPMLYVGEGLGAGSGPDIDIALDPLEGATLVAKAMPNALAVLAIAPRGGLLRVPNIYMEKLAIGPGHKRGVVDLDALAGENATRLARSRGVDVSEITVCVLDRPRHDRIIADLRRAGARIYLISDGDVAGVIHTAYPETGIDMYVGVGGAPEGVLAAAALKCVGGQFQSRLFYRNDTDRQKAARAGVTEINRRYELEDMATSDAVFAATGVTKGWLLDGVRRAGGMTHTHTLVMSSFDGTVRTIRSAAPLPG